jgi:malate dehydrogenase (oxaloacetate-decarboxylating)(NADP+)
MPSSEQKAAELRRAALDYHEFPTPGKVSIAATKQLVNQHDLALAYSPGVAAACEEIVVDPANAFRYTARGNLVAVITNGTAVLGLGDIGPLAAKPVMEGKGVLFKKFAGIDVFDIEVNEKNLDKLIDLIAALEPTFGGINLEDIKAPDCFYVERALRSRMNIPVFHDDQHGTAIVVGAGVLNALKVSGKNIRDVKLVTSGAGAAALACLGLLVKLGVPRENIWVTDLAGVVYEGRTELMDEDKVFFAQKTSHRTLADVIAGADIFLGLSAAGVLKKQMVAAMAANPVIFALANPTPEILPEEVLEVRSDAIMATGPDRLPEPDQQRPLLPVHLPGRARFGRDHDHRRDGDRRGACDRGAGAGRAERGRGRRLCRHRAQLRARVPDPEAVRPAPDDADRAGRREGGRPIPGVALRPIADLDAYRSKLQSFVYASGATMRPIFSMAKNAPNKRVAYAEGEEERVLRAVQVVVDEGVARPTLIGRPEIIAQRIAKFGLRLSAGRDYDVVNTEHDDRFRSYWTAYQKMTARKGVTAQLAKIEMRRRLTLIGSMLLKTGEVDGLLCGTWGGPTMHLHYIDQVIGLREGARTYAVHELADAAGPPGHAGRHPHQLRPDRRAARRDHDHGGRGDEALRPAAEGRAAVAQQLRHQQPAVGGQDAAGAGAAARTGARARGRRRDARRRGARRAVPDRPDARHAADRRSQPAGPAEHRRRQHQLQPVEGRGRRRHRDRPGAARRGPAGPHPDAVGDGSSNHQHDRIDGRRRQRRALAEARS